MGLTKYKLGELIELVLKMNSELRYGPDDVRGMTITKEIIPTKADVTGTDLSKFLVVSPGEFILATITQTIHLLLVGIILHSE